MLGVNNLYLRACCFRRCHNIPRGQSALSEWRRRPSAKSTQWVERFFCPFPMSQNSSRNSVNLIFFLVYLILQSFSVKVTISKCDNNQWYYSKNGHFGPLGLTTSCHNKQFVTISDVTITKQDCITCWAFGFTDGENEIWGERRNSKTVLSDRDCLIQ